MDTAYITQCITVSLVPCTNSRTLLVTLPMTATPAGSYGQDPYLHSKIKLFLLSGVAAEVAEDQPTLRRCQASVGKEKAGPKKNNAFPVSSCGRAPNSHSCSQPPTSLGKPWAGSLLSLPAGLHTYPLESLGSPLRARTHARTRISTPSAPAHYICTQD